MSAFWLGRNLNIQTWPLNENVGFEVEVDLDKIRETRSAKSNVYSIPKAFESGTIITISKISDSKWPMGRGQGKLRSLLASMYRLYLNDPDFPVEINFNGKALSFSELRVLKEPFWPNTQGPQKDSPVIEWERYFTFKTTNGHQIGGRVALLERMSLNCVCNAA